MSARLFRSATDEELRILESALERVSKAGTRRLMTIDRRKLFADHQKRFDRWSARMKAALRPWYDALEREVIAKLTSRSAEFASKAGGGLESLLFDEDDAAGALSSALRELYLDAYAQCGRFLLGSMGAGVSFDLDNPRARDLLAQRETLMKTVASDAQERCRSTLNEGMAKGETIEQLTARVKEWAEEGRESYAENVARTETGSALNEAASESYRQAGCTTKTWLSVVDDRSRPDHADLDGVTIGFNEQFELDSGSYDGPHDPAMGPEDVCNCRCTLAGGFDD